MPSTKLDADTKESVDSRADHPWRSWLSDEGFAELGEDRNTGLAASALLRRSSPLLLESFCEQVESCRGLNLHRFDSTPLFAASLLSL
ncbi:MAG: hypothetical protein V3W41_17380 [Planctomycetota bacterium]